MKRLIAFSITLCLCTPLSAQKDNVFEPEIRSEITFTRGRRHDHTLARRASIATAVLAGGVAVAYKRNSDYLHKNVLTPMVTFLKEHPDELKGALSLAAVAGAMLAYKNGLFEKAITTLGELKEYLESLGGQQEDEPA